MDPLERCVRFRSEWLTQSLGEKKNAMSYIGKIHICFTRRDLFHKLIQVGSAQRKAGISVNISQSWKPQF